MSTRHHFILYLGPISGANLGLVRQVHHSTCDRGGRSCLSNLIVIRLIEALFRLVFWNNDHFGLVKLPLCITLPLRCICLCFLCCHWVEVLVDKPFDCPFYVLAFNVGELVVDVQEEVVDWGLECNVLLFEELVAE